MNFLTRIVCSSWRTCLLSKGLSKSGTGFSWSARHLFTSGVRRPWSLRDGPLKRLLSKVTYDSLPRDVLIYENVQHKKLRMIQIAGICQLAVFVYCSQFVVLFLESDQIKQMKERVKLVSQGAAHLGRELYWWEKFAAWDEKYKYGVIALCLLFGFGSAFLISLYTARNVKSIVLKKNGTIQITTLGPLPLSRSIRQFEVPLNDCSCIVSRQNKSTYTTFKVRNKMLYFLIDKEGGTFVNPELFDRTLGISRNLKSK